MVYANKHYETEACRWEGNGSSQVVATIPLSTNPNNKPYCGVSVHEVRFEFDVNHSCRAAVGVGRVHRHAGGDADEGLAGGRHERHPGALHVQRR